MRSTRMACGSDTAEHLHVLLFACGKVGCNDVSIRMGRTSKEADLLRHLKLTSAAAGEHVLLLYISQSWRSLPVCPIRVTDTKRLKISCHAHGKLQAPNNFHVFPLPRSTKGKSFHRLCARLGAVIIVDFYIDDFIFAFFIVMKDGKAFNYNGTVICPVLNGCFV